ncbi:MAG: hypothetical protein LWX51_18245 [Deltaproteobacteria bacterium]|jgi:adenine-specific DNA-methyltransferase|nr:hypothetical protein [Deltaproteobacteria bacterium]
MWRAEVKKNIAMCLLDTDYDNKSLSPNQVLFPTVGSKDGWSRLAKKPESGN